MVDIYSSEKRSAIMSLVRGRDTKPEKIVRSALHRLGLRFRLAAADLPGRPDIVFRSRKIALFVNGCYWHGHGCTKGISRAKVNEAFWTKKLGDNLKRDRKNYIELQNQGWRVVVVWECETRDIVKLGFRLAEEFSI